MSETGGPGHGEALDCYERALAKGLTPIAPDLVLYEMGGVISRGRTEAGRAERLLEVYQMVEVARPSVEALTRALTLAEPRKLSFYDAAYVALAEERGAILWTEDKELLKRFPKVTASTAELARRLG